MYYFIVNPKSSSGKGLKIWRQVEAILQANHVAHEVFFTEHPGHATKLAEKISVRHAPCTIVAVGGDGTANEVICGLQLCSQLRFGYIPTGSGNDLARGLSLPVSPEKAVSAILHPQKILDVDIGSNCFDAENRRFIVSTGIGFDAAVCHEAMRSKIKQLLNRFGLGKLTYLGIALKQLCLLKPCAASVVLDDGGTLCFDHIFFIAVMNLKYEGGGFMFCPDADFSDGYLDVCLVEQMPKLKILCLLPTAFWGKHTKYKGIHIMRCRKISIRANQALAIHTDGESRTSHHAMDVSLAKEKLPFIVQ